MDTTDDKPDATENWCNDCEDAFYGPLSHGCPVCGEQRSVFRISESEPHPHKGPRRRVERDPIGSQAKDLALMDVARMLACDSGVIGELARAWLAVRDDDGMVEFASRLAQQRRAEVAEAKLAAAERELGNMRLGVTVDVTAPLPHRVFGCVDRVMVVFSLEDARDKLGDSMDPSLASSIDRAFFEGYTSVEIVPKHAPISHNTREHERADVLDFMRCPPGRVPESMREFLAELIHALERGSHIHAARRLYGDLPYVERLPDGWSWSEQDPTQATGPVITTSGEQAHRFVAVVGENLEFQYKCDCEPLDVVMAVIARHARTGRRRRTAS